MRMRSGLESRVLLLDARMMLTMLRDEAEGYIEPGCRLLRCEGYDGAVENGEAARGECGRGAVVERGEAGWWRRDLDGEEGG